MAKLKPKEKFIKNLVSSKFQVLMFVELVLTAVLVYCALTAQGWEVVVGLAGVMMTGAGYYFKKKVDQNIGLERVNLDMNHFRQTEP